MQLKQELDGIFSILVPYKDIFTTVYVIRTEEGVLLFDAASYDSDISDILLPALEALSISPEELRGVFISHNHTDHAGGLAALLAAFPALTVYSRSEKLREKHRDADVRSFSDGERILGDLYAITLPGHTPDSAGVLCRRRACLISGDSLQLHGIFGSGLWGANVRYPAAHLEALEKLRQTEGVEHLYTAHHYEPYGRCHHGREAILRAIEACRQPLLEVRELIEAHPALDDAAIAALYNAKAHRPTLGAHVVTALREL